MIVGIGAIFFLVSNPSQCKFLDERERHIAMERLLLDHRIDWMERVERRHVKAAICNINTTICAIGFMCAALTVNSLTFSMVRSCHLALSILPLSLPSRSLQPWLTPHAHHSPRSSKA